MDSEQSKIENHRLYMFAVGDKTIGSFIRTGESRQRTYTVVNGAGENIGQVSRYRFVRAIFAVLLNDFYAELEAADKAEAWAPDMVRDLEKFLESHNG